MDAKTAISSGYIFDTLTRAFFSSFKLTDLGRTEKYGKIS